MDEHLKIKNTELADETLSRDNYKLPRSNSDLFNTTHNVWIICAVLIFSFNVVATLIALITIGTKGYDPYIHGSAMFISVFTLGCIATIHKYILGE